MKFYRFIIFVAILIKETKFGVIIALLNFSTLKYFLFTTLTLQVQNLFPDCKKASSFGQCFLKSLPKANCLKPAVWAHQKNKPENYGVSLGVRPFVRPLYLYTKLSRLNVEDDQLSLKGVIALKISRLNDHLIPPCVGCQCFFGLFSFPPFGNCAEYDVIGNVKSDLLQTDQWEEFKSVCQQHVSAFNTMLGMLKEANYSYEKILKIYFEKTMKPKLPKVLKYQWNPGEKDFDLTLEDWLPPVLTEQN
jgi:hypothetical protein